MCPRTLWRGGPPPPDRPYPDDAGHTGTQNLYERVGKRSPDQDPPPLPYRRRTRTTMRRKTDASKSKEEGRGSLHGGSGGSYNGGQLCGYGWKAAERWSLRCVLPVALA